MALTDDLIPSSDLVIDSRRAFSGMSDGASGGFGRPSPSPVSFRDPAWDSAEVAASEKTGVPLEILRSIRVNGERSNGDQVSPKGARGVYQFIPTTRDAFLRKYGVDAYSQDPVEQATVAALHLRESYDRTGDWGRSVAGYNGGRSGENGTNRTVENAEYVRRVMGGLPSGGAGMANKEPAAEYFGQRDLASSPKIAPPTMGDYAKKAGSSMLRGIGTIGEAFGDAAAFVANKATGTQDFEGFNPLESTSRKIEESMTEGGRAAAADGFKGDVTDPSTWQAPETAYGAVMAGVDALGNIGSFLLPAALTGGWSLVSKAANLSKMAKAAAAAGDVARAAELTKAASAASRAATAHGAAQGAGMTYGDAANDAKEFAKQTISKMSHAELMEQTPIYRDAINSGADETFARNLVVNRAGQMGGLLAAGPGALGGAMANKLLGQVIGRRAMPSILGGAMGNRAVRAGVEGGLVGLAEGTGEVAEKMGSNAGGNIAVGRDFADNIGRDTLPEGVGGFIAGGHTGAVAGAMSPNPIPPPKPQPNPVAEAAAKPNSPLSRAAAAGNPDIAAQSTDLDAAPVGAAQDPISARVSEIEAAVGDGGLMDRLRTLNEQSPGLTQQVLGAFATAKNPNAPQALREQSLATLEGALDAIGLAAAGRAGAQWQGLAGEQEGSLSGLRAASIAGQQWQGLSAQPVDNAVDNPAPKTAPEVDNRAPVAPAVAVEEPEKPRKTVAAPAVSVKDVAGEDPKLPPAVRQRRAQLSAMVNTGFDVVEQRDGKFFLVNHGDNYEMPLENAGDAARATAIINAKVDNEAHQSINSPLNDKNPATEAQIAADNYPKPVVRRFGLELQTENPRDSVRSGVDEDGQPWSVTMTDHYGGLKGTKAADGSLVDGFFGRGHRIFVIDQINPKTGLYDEAKAMIGYRSEDEARKAYLSNYAKGWKGLGAITEMSIPEFRKWVKSSAAALPVSPTIKTSQEVKNDGAGSTQGSDQAGGRVRGAQEEVEGDAGSRDARQPEGYAPERLPGAASESGSQADGGARDTSVDAHSARVGQIPLERSLRAAERSAPIVAEAAQHPKLGDLKLADPNSPATQALDSLLDVFESLTGHRGIAVQIESDDGFKYKGNSFISVNKPHMHVGWTIAHEFKHLTERHPGLKALYDRIWSMIDNEAGKREYFEYLKRTEQIPKSSNYATASAAELALLKDEMVADFMGKRFYDKAWLTELGKKKPELFGNFIRDWIKALGQIIGDLMGKKRAMEGVKNVDLYISQLQEAKAIAMEVAEEWAKMHPGYARRTGVSQAIQAARSADAAFSAKATDGVEIQNHDKWSIYQERSAQVGDGYVRWVEDPDTAYVTDIQAGQKTRGRELLQWLKDTTGKSLYAVGVVDSASEFWDRMEEDGLIDGQTDEDFMSFFGRASFSAKDYNINTSRDDDDEGTFFTADSTTRKTQAGGAYPIAHLHVPDEAVKTDGWRIGDIYVDAGRRREGVASALVDAASKHFGSRPLGATSVFSEDGQKFWDGISKSAKDNDLAEDDYASLQAELDAEMGQAAEPARMPEVEPDVSDAAIRKAGIHAEDAFPAHKWSGGGDQHTLSIKGLYGGNRTVRLAIERISDGAYSTSIGGAWVGPASNESTGYVSLKGAKAFIDRQIAARELRARGYDLASSLPAEQRAAMRNGWEAINAMGDEFGVRKFHLTSELDTSIQDLAKSMGLTEAYKVTSNEEVNDRDNKTLVIAFTDKATGKTQSGTVSMTRIRGKWHTSASTIEFKKGGLGTAFYQLAVEHLARKGLQLSPEATLSGINTYRRTEQMLAAALRIGISNAMVPHPVQRVYGFQNDAQSDAEHAANLERLLIANLRNVRELVPEFDRLRYHPETGAITFKNGRDAEKVVERLIGHRGEKLTTQTDARAFGLGRTTLARALMTQAMLDGKFQEPESFAEPVTYSARDQAAIEYEAVEARYKGTPQWMKAPNGKPTNLTERQWVQTRTAMFKQWFGDWEKFSGLPGGVWNDDKGEVSKVVDENGEPLVVYHGSDEGGFMAFKTPGGQRRGDLGIFTTSDYDMARSYVRRSQSKEIEATKEPRSKTDLEELDYQFESRELNDTEFRVRSSSGSLFVRSSMEQAQQTADRVGGVVTRVDSGHVDYFYMTPDGYAVGPFDSESESVERALENADSLDGNVAGGQPGIYALFVNLRNPGEADFEGATWSGSREHQWVVEVGGEIQSDANGTQYFNSKEDAADFAQTFVADDAEGDDADPLSYVRGADDHYESTDDAVRGAWADGSDGVIIRNVIDDGGGPSRYMGEPRDVFVARRGGQLKSANWNTGEFGTSTDDLRFSKKTDTQSPPLQPRASRITDLARQNVVSTRSPTGPKAVENQMTNMLTGTFDAFGREPALVSKAVAAFRGYAPIKLRRGLSNVGVLNSSIAQMANNLTWLYDKVPANIRERSKLWYVGVRRVADRMSGRYGIDARQAAGVIATQSPQKDWFENVSLADRIIHIWTNYQDHAWDRHMDAAIERVTSAEALAEMADNAEGDGYDTREAAIQKLVGARLAKARKSGNELSAADARQQVLDSLTQKSEAARRLVDAVRGKKLSEVWDDKHRAVWVRVFDSAHISPHYHVVNPEGNFVGLRTTSRQTPSNIRWGTFGATAKSISILRDGTLENISNQLGAEHKIRNFYNNIIDPFNPGQDITIDTHAVAADLMMPLSGNSLPVSHNFGSSGGSTIYGLSGTYPVHHEAYSRAAAGKGVLGREMQSITWEAVRGLFTAPFKSKSANVDHVNSIWERYKSGEISQADARNEIIRYVMAKTGRTEAEIFTPEWFGSTDAPQSETSFDMKRDVPAAPLRGRVDSGIYAEVAPNPDLVKRGGSRLLAKWAALSEDEKMNVTRNVGAPIIHKVMARLGIKAYDIEFGMGGFEGETNPSITIHFGPSVPYGAQMEAAKVIGVLWKQKAMIAYDERDSGGGTQFVKVAASRPLDYNGAAELFRKITQAFPAAAGVSLRDGALVFGNFTDGAVSEQDFHDGIDAVLASLQDEKSFNTNSTTFRSDWIEPVTLEGTRYGQGNTQGDQAGRDVPGWERDFGAIQSESDERFAREVGYAFERVQARGRSAGSAGDVRDAVQRSARPSAGRGGHLDPSEPDLQRGAQGSLAERPDQPAAGGRPDRALRIQGAVHFGKAPGLSVLSGSASGTGIKGAEQERLSQAGVDPRLKRRVYFYLPVDGGIPQPEIGLGTHVYKADLDNLYDPTEGKIRGEGNPFELAVLNAGYDGYVNREQGTAVLLNRDAPVSYEGRSYDHKLVQRRIERVIPKTVTRQSGDELVRRPEASELGGVIRNREAIKAAAPSFRMEFGEARVKIDEAPAADRALEEAGSPFRFGEVSMSARDPLDDYLASRNKTLTTVTPRSVLEADIDLASNALEAAVAEIKSGNYRQMSVPIGPVPHVLRMLGFPTQMLRADMSIVKKILLDKHDDDFDAVLPRDIVMSIYRPAMVLSGRNPGEFEIISDLLTEDGPVMFVVKKDTTRGANSAKVASIMSAYAVSTGGPGDTIGKRILSGKLIYADMLTAQSAITGQKEESQSLWTGFENSEALGEGSTTGGHNSARLPQSTASGQIVQTANHLVNPRNARYARWRVVSSKILGDIAAKKIKTDVDLIGWIAKHYKGDIADVPSFSARSPIGFYSELSEQIEKSTMRQAPAAAWKTFIKALSQKGVKPDEVEWTGVNEWLDLQEGKVSKDALLDYLGANGVQVQEVALGNRPEGLSVVDDPDGGYVVQSSDGTIIDGPYDTYSRAERAMDRQGEKSSATRYGKYTLQGGTNYREVLLMLPQPSTELTPAEKRRLSYLESSGYGDPNDPTVGDELKAEVAALRAKSPPSEPYTSPHWDQPNVLAHIRLNDRVSFDEPRRRIEARDDFFTAKVRAQLPLDVVQGGVLAAAHDDHVRKAIVAALPVDVVNALRAEKVSPEDLFGNDSVRLALLPSSDGGFKILPGLITALRRTEADVGAKVRGSLIAGLDEQVLPALRTSDFEPSVVRRLLASVGIDDGSKPGFGSAEFGGARSGATLARADGSGSKSNGADGASLIEKHEQIIAHRDRTDADGKRVLFVEEIQSDWGQSAKKDGFKQDPSVIQKLKADLAKAEQAKRDAEVAMGVVEDLTTKPLYYNGTDEDRARIDRRISETRDAYFGVAVPNAMRARAALQDAEHSESNAVPRAPFIDKTDKWLNLALKRVITMAVEGGYDKIAFIDGQQSADRYDLSKHIKQIDTAKMAGDYYMVIATDRVGKTVIDKAIAKDALPDVLGKDLSERIIKDGGGTYSGLDLKVGGEGMKTFYDSIIPNAVKALAKKLGGEVGETTIGQPMESRSDYSIKERATGGYIARIGSEAANFTEWADANAWLNERFGTKQFSLTITPAMQAKVEDGLPLFSKRDATWTDDRIDRLMSKYAYTMDDNRTKAYAAWVRPQDFLDATTPADFKGKLESEKSPLDKDQLMREVQEIQLISRDHPKSGGVFKTEGHEGRHRMMALRDAGVERVPVTLTIPTKNGAEPLTSVFVTAQKWSGGPSAQSGFTVERMIPISWAHHDELKAEFDGEGEVSFSAKDQTETPEFKKWFGNSRVVDESGAPLRVFTGTSKDVDFKAFKVPKNGVWFTTDPESASQYAVENDSMDIKTKDYRTFEHVNTASRVIPAYLRIENPYKLSDAEMDRIRYASNYKREQGQLFDSVRARGYDGVDMGGGTWVVLKEPAQIKSSVGNNGDFDGGKGDISRSARDDDYALRQSSREIVGDVGRAYTADQKAAFARVGFEVEQPSLKERAQALWKDAGKKLAQGLFDQFAPVRELSQGAYGLLRLAKGSAGSFETLLKGGKLKLTDGVYDFDESQRGGVIDRLLIPMQGEHHDFLRWVAANRAEGLLAEGRENLFTQDDIDAIKTLQDGQLGFDYTLQHGPRAGSTTRVRAEMYADSLKTFNEFNKNVLDMASQSGLIDEESRHLWEGEFYVPFYRVSEEDGLQGANIKGGVVRQKAFQKLKGGKDVLNADLLDNTLMNWAHLLDASAKNRAAKATLGAAEAAGAAIPASEDIARQIGKATGNRHGVVWFMDQGMQRFYLVEDPYLMSAITSLEYAGMKNPVMNAMSAVKHYLTVGVTASPFFKVRNLIRDSVQAVASAELSYNPGKNLAEGWAASDQKGDLYFRLLAGGGTIHFGTMLEGSEARRVQALVEAGVNPDNILDNNHKLVAFYKRRIKPAIDAYNELGNRGETINRAALYKQLIAHGKSHAEASLMARDLMDFSMQGNFATIRFLTQVVPFLNARLQGLNKLGKAARENPQRMAMVMGAVAMLSLSLLALYGDDDDWKKREDWDRDNFWWFKIGGIAYRAPKPFEVGAFGTLAERSAELIFSDEMTGDRFRSRVMALLGDNLSMNPVPQLVKPMLDVYANKDGFSGRPIETMGMDRLQAPYRFTANTSMTARAASTAMNAVTGLVGKESLSPVQVDSLIRGYFGWLGTFIVGGVDIVARKATDQPTRPTPDLWKVATGGMISQLDDAKSRYVSQVYDQARAIEQAYGTWRSLQKEGKTEQAADFREANIEKIQAYRNVEAIKGAMTKINQRIRDVEASDLSRDEKRDEVRRLNQRKDEFARRLAPA